MKAGSPSRAARGALLLGALLARPGGELPGQVARLDAVDSLAARGETAAARELLGAWWESRRDGASREEIQRAYWLRGKLSLAADEAERAYRHLVVEYPGGPYTARALLRLGLAAEARGEAERAGRYYRTLLRDYPWSPVRTDAERALGRLGPAGAGGEAGPEASGGAGAGEGVRDAGTGERTSGAPRRHTVQLGAFSSVERARSLAERARGAGFDPRVVRVRGADLLRVRAGRFDDGDAAARLFERIRRAGFEAVLMDDAHREERVP